MAQVQEFMLLAGEVAATYAKDRELPFIYRCQATTPHIPSPPTFI